MGGGRFLTAIRQTTGPILDPKTAYDSFGLELYAAKFYVKVTDDVTGRVKGQMFCLSLLASKQPYQTEIKRIERHGSFLGYF